MSLEQLGLKHKTDKYSHGYLPLYEKYIKELGPVKEVLEIGVRTGASLRMWEEYFPHANITGIDIDPACEQHETERINVYIGDQADPEFMKHFDDDYDLIIDDGSHVNEWTVTTFNLLFNNLRKGGIYILEDMQCSYQDLQALNVREKWSGMTYTPEIPKQDRGIIDQLLADMSHYVDKDFASSLHIHRNFILIVR